LDERHRYLFDLISTKIDLEPIDIEEHILESPNVSQHFSLD